MGFNFGIIYVITCNQFQQPCYQLYKPIQQFQQITMLNPPTFSLNNRSSAYNTSSRKNQVKKAYTPAASQKKQSKTKKDDKSLNRSISRIKNEPKNNTSSILKTPKKEKVNPEKTTSKKQSQYKEVKFREMSGGKSDQSWLDKKNKRKIEMCQTENQRLEMLKEYLHEDAEKVKQMKLISDHHVLSEMKLTQESLKRKLNEGYIENSKIIEEHKKEMEELKNTQNSLIKQHQQNIKSMSRELNDERMRNKLLESQLKECNKLSRKEQEYEYTSVKQAMNPEAARKINKLETEVTQLESKVATFASIKKELEEEIRRHRKEKEHIKRQSEEVLQFIRSEYSQYQRLSF